MEKVVRDRRSYHIYELTAQLREYWKNHPGEVTTLELGAPSKVSSANRRKISELVKHSAISPNCGRILFRLALWSEAETIVELGTNAGISTLYLHYADRRAQLHTIEGNPEVAGLARKTFEIARCRASLHQYVGTFEELLQPVLDELDRVDLLFVDGDHRYPQTVEYVKNALPKLHAGSVVVVADIHWSEGMERAWAELINLPEITASLDLYHFGILFFKPGMTPHQHLSLVSTRWKPWRVGFFS